jgi:Glyoxalase superfamily protein
MLETIKDAKVAVRVLRRFVRELGDKGAAVSHNDALHLLARMTGCTNWNELEARLVKDTSGPDVSSVNPGALHDEVTAGTTGRMRTRDGVEIIGTSDLIPAMSCAGVAIRSVDGSLKVEYTDDVRLDWNAQYVRALDGQRCFYDSNYRVVPENEIVLVANED